MPTYFTIIYLHTRLPTLVSNHGNSFPLLNHMLIIKYLACQVKQLWYFLFSNWWSDVHNFCNFFWFKLILFFITLVTKVDLSTQNSRPQGIWGYRRGCHVWQIRAKNLRLGHKQTTNTKSQIKTTRWRVEEEGGHFSSFAPRSLTSPTICKHNKGRIMYKVGTFSLPKSISSANLADRCLASRSR